MEVSLFANLASQSAACAALTSSRRNGRFYRCPKNRTASSSFLTSHQQASIRHRTVSWWPSQRRGAAGKTSLMVASFSEFQLVESEEVYHEVMAKNDVLVVEWMARWCRKCTYLKPKLEKLLMTEFPGVNMVFVDVNAMPGGIVVGAGVKKMPTVQVWVKGEKVAEHICSEDGAIAVGKVRDLLKVALEQE